MESLNDLSLLFRKTGIVGGTSSDGEAGARTRGSRGQRGVKDLQIVGGLRITQREEKN